MNKLGIVSLCLSLLIGCARLHVAPDGSGGGTGGGIEPSSADWLAQSGSGDWLAQSGSGDRLAQAGSGDWPAQPGNEGNAATDSGTYNAVGVDQSVGSQPARYQRFDTSLTWHDAEAFCRTQGGHLATITSPEEDAYVYRTLAASAPTEMVWLGGTDSANEGVWAWVTGEPWSYTGWDAGEPNNSAGIEHYLVYFTSRDPLGRAGLWNDLGVGLGGGCGGDGCAREWYPMSFICEWDALPYVEVTCETIFQADPSSADGVYSLKVAGRTFDAYCLMSEDGGGWTMVASYPPGTTPAVPVGWAGGDQVGSGFSSPASLFKMPDSLINAMKTSAYRVHGTASQCISGPCTVDTMLYWRPDCEYSSSANSDACSTAYLDPGFTRPTPSAFADPHSCPWHRGLVDTSCDQISSTITSHDPYYPPGFVVCTGDLSDFALHACNGRNGEISGIEMWVR